MKKIIPFFILLVLFLLPCAAWDPGDEDALQHDIDLLFRKQIIDTAKQYLGAPYKYAGRDPKGFDCSGFIWFTFYQAGIQLPRSTGEMWKSGRPVALAELRPGDILVFSTVKSGASHAGIVLESSENGVTFIHAASQGAKLGIIISSLNETYYKTRFMGARAFF